MHEGSIVIAYKLMRKMKDGYAPLFINKRMRLQKGERYQAEYHPTKGFATRRGWHCTLKPEAPHLKETIDNRVWVKVKLYTVGDTAYVKHYSRPESQGGTWVLCTGQMEIIEEL